MYEFTSSHMTLTCSLGQTRCRLQARAYMTTVPHIIRSGNCVQLRPQGTVQKGLGKLPKCLCVLTESIDSKMVLPILFCHFPPSFFPIAIALFALTTVGKMGTMMSELVIVDVRVFLKKYMNLHCAKCSFALKNVLTFLFINN